MAFQPRTSGLRQGFDNPLLDFEGTLTEVVHRSQNFEAQPGGQSARTQWYVALRFSDLRVHDSKTPWNLPTAEVEIPASEMENSRWGLFAQSLNKFLGEDEATSLVQAGAKAGPRMRLIQHVQYGQNYEMGEDRRAPKDGITGKRPPILIDWFEVTEIVGHSAGNVNGQVSSAEARMLDLLHGKDINTFQHDAIADPVIRSDQALSNAIINGQIIPRLVAEGKVIKVGDTYEVVGNPHLPGGLPRPGDS